MKALVVVAVLAVASACTSSPIPVSTPGSAASPTSSAQVNSEDPIEAPRSVALMESKRLVGLANVPPEARAQSWAPLPSLEQPPEEPSSRYLLDTAVWWSLVSTASNVLSWLRNHPPEGLRAAGEGSGTTVTGPVWYLRYEDEAAPAYSAATLFVEVAPHGSSGSAVRVDGQTMWLPRAPLGSTSRPKSRVSVSSPTVARAPAMRGRSWPAEPSPVRRPPSSSASRTLSRATTVDSSTARSTVAFASARRSRSPATHSSSPTCPPVVRYRSHRTAGRCPASSSRPLSIARSPRLFPA
jgi:hypothetical protein